MVCINSVGYPVVAKHVTTRAFDDIAGVCSKRFRQSVEQDLFHVHTVLDDKKQPLGYCSFWTDVVPSPRNDDQNVYFYQIHYVYIRPDYRGLRLANTLAKMFVCHALNELREHKSVTALCDKSHYTSDGGIVFGQKVQRLLTQTKSLPFV